MTSTNKVRAAAQLDLAKLIASATVAQTTVTAYTDRAAVRAWEETVAKGSKASDEERAAAEEARERAVASRITIRVRRATPAQKAEAITRFGDDREGIAGLPSETVYNQRIEHIAGAAVLEITDAEGATAPGPVDQPTMAQLRVVIGEHAWGKLRDFATGDSDDSALDADFSQAPSGATPS